jgi:hypothetical protein
MTNTGKAPELPEPEKVLKNLYQRTYGWIGRHLGVLAATAFATLAAILIFLPTVLDTLEALPKVKEDLEIIPGVSTVSEWLHDVTHPLPKANPEVFTVAIARLEDDDEKAHMEVNITRDLRDLGKSNGIAVLEFPRIISDQYPQAGHTKAREWLRKSGAQVLIWGRVLVVSGKPEVPQLYWTNSESSSEKKESGRYALDENLRLPTAFQSDLSDILRLLVVTQSSAFNTEEGHFVADRLRPFIERVRHLLEGAAAKNWSPEDIARTKLILGDALFTVTRPAATVH